MFIVHHTNILYNHKSFLQQNILEYYFVCENVIPTCYTMNCAKIKQCQLSVKPLIVSTTQDFKQHTLSPPFLPIHTVTLPNTKGEFNS